MGAVSWYRTWNHPIGCARLLCPTMALATMGSPISRISMASMLVRRWAIHSGWCKLKRSFRSDVSAPRCLESDQNRNIWSCQVLIQLEIRHFSTSPPTLIPQFAQRAQRYNLRPAKQLVQPAAGKWIHTAGPHWKIRVTILQGEIKSDVGNAASTGV